jgi:hypothetical protein
LGQWSALCSAIGFTLLLNFGLTITLVYPEWFPREISLVVWLAVVVCWGIGFSRNWWQRATLLEVDSATDDVQDDLFHQAQTDYLCGDWESAAALAERVLFQNPRDVEARLLLASVLRRQNLFDESRRQIEIAGNYDGAVKWADEIENELDWLDMAEAEADEIVALEPDKGPELPQENKDNSDLPADSARTGISETDKLETIDKEAVVGPVDSSPREQLAKKLSTIVSPRSIASGQTVNSKVA